MVAQPHMAKRKDGIECGAKLKNGKGFCTNPPMPNGKCWTHGGATPAGPASPHYVHGQRSKYLPRNLRAKYEEAIASDELLSLRPDVALLEARQNQLLEAIDTGETEDRWSELADIQDEMSQAYEEGDIERIGILVRRLGSTIGEANDEREIWRAIHSTINQKARLVESERRRDIEQGQMVALSQNLMLMQAIADLIKRHVDDQRTLTAIASGLVSLFGLSPVNTGAKQVIDG